MGKEHNAKLILENGKVFSGTAFGSVKDAVGEVVFTTGMTGYQELLTDPAYANKLVVMTYPLIGNYGINLEDMESDKVLLNGFIVREKCEVPNNWRCEMELEGFLKQKGIMAIEGIDTRALTRIIRDNGAMKGIITTKELSDADIKKYFEDYSDKGVINKTTCAEKHSLNQSASGKSVAVIDLGVKNSALNKLQALNCKLDVFPAFSSVEEILEASPDMVYVSSGAGDLDELKSVVENVKAVIDKNIPVVGEGLGHHIIALALGCEVEKLKYGHHGGYPVKDVETGKVLTTSQAHEYAVSKLGEDVVASHININDKTISAVKHNSKPVYAANFALNGGMSALFFEKALKSSEEVMLNA